MWQTEGSENKGAKKNERKKGKKEILFITI